MWVEAQKTDSAISWIIALIKSKTLRSQKAS